MQQIAQFARKVAHTVAGFFLALWRRTAPIRESLRQLPTWKRIAVWTGAGVLAVVLLAAGAAAVIWPGLPDLDRLTDYNPKQPLRVYSEDGQLLAEYGTERRSYLPLEKIPKQMQLALLAVEDTNFYDHQGVYVPGMLRALLPHFDRVVMTEFQENPRAVPAEQFLAVHGCVGTHRRQPNTILE